VDPDLRKRIRPHWPEAWYVTRDQKGGFNIVDGTIRVL